MHRKMQRFPPPCMSRLFEVHLFAFFPDAPNVSGSSHGFVYGKSPDYCYTHGFEFSGKEPVPSSASR